MSNTAVLLNFICGSIWSVLERLRIPYKLLCESPPEFTHNFLSDPINYKIYSYFIYLKNAYEAPVAATIYKIFERNGYEPLEIYAHDLIGGEPAWLVGFSGRDIDYFVVADERPPREFISKVETCLDNVVGASIALYYHKTGMPCIPFNKVINHNLIEIHVINPAEKQAHGLTEKNPIKKYDRCTLQEMVKSAPEYKIGCDTDRLMRYCEF